MKRGLLFFGQRIHCHPNLIHQVIFFHRPLQILRLGKYQIFKRSEMGAAANHVDGAIPRHHRKPRTKAASLGNEPSGLPPNLQQYLLHHVLREIGLPQYAQRNRINQARVFVEDRRHCSLILQGDSFQQLGIFHLHGFRFFYRCWLPAESTRHIGLWIARRVSCGNSGRFQQLTLRPQANVGNTHDHYKHNRLNWMTAPFRIRIDSLLVKKGLVPSRERARALILAGRVLVSEQKVDKPGMVFTEEVPIRILGEDLRYVSRGGLKLEAALKHWSIPTDGRDCLDIGTSTGGFTDCLLQHGASHVSCVDTGFGQIAMKLRNDPKVKLYERTNARLLAAGSLNADPGTDPPRPPLTLLVMDVSFISATLVFPAVLAAAPSLTETVVLVKPQFEAGREHIGKGGIVREPAAHQLAIDRVIACVSEAGGHSIEVIDSPITGMEGNKEFLLHALFRESPASQ
jgi:23S rRNA (cytidine1920-2'-O)/16S rRNA (cytidine1409-2'-O)-methyltransferase